MLVVLVWSKISSYSYPSMSLHCASEHLEPVEISKGTRSKVFRYCDEVRMQFMFRDLLVRLVTLNKKYRYRSCVDEILIIWSIYSYRNEESDHNQHAPRGRSRMWKIRRAKGGSMLIILSEIAFSSSW